ncbi:MAG: pilus assembly protein PilP [Desulfamplus sp.]|nr:pilus assembly protein PilP [Desulfamplus sp.]
MIYFKRIKSIYILIPLFLMVITSCENKATDETPQIVQEVITMKIAPMAQQSPLTTTTLEDNQNSPVKVQESASSTASPVASGEQITTVSPEVSASGEQINTVPPVSVSGGQVTTVLPSVSGEQTESSSKTEVLSQPEIIFDTKSTSKQEIVLQTPAESEKIPEISLSKPSLLPDDASGTAASVSIKGDIVPAKGDVASIADTENAPTSDKNLAENSVSLDAASGNVAGSSENKTLLPAEALLPAGDIQGQMNEEKLFYIAKGKTDPFEPLIKEKVPVEQIQETITEDVPKRILTPLEKLDFGQMKLVAILNRESESVAMVQESTGKGYIVNIGTYMGRDSGQVISIEKDKLVIQEKVKDYKGNVVDRFQELKLNKLDDKG